MLSLPQKYVQRTMIKKLLLAIGLLGLFSVCKGQENVEQQTVMPQGKLLRVKYAYHGMRMAEFSDFDLKRCGDKGSSELTFRHHSSNVSVDGVADSLFNEASRIIEEERMFEYGSHYSLPPELEKTMLDGFRWSFEAYFDSGEHIISAGRHVMPDGKGLYKIEKLLYDAAEAITNATLDK